MILNTGVSGRYKLVVRKAVGELQTENDPVVRETPWFSNMIVDTGLEAMATTCPFFYCGVGTGNAAPAVTQTNLISPYPNASAPSRAFLSREASGTQVSTAPYYWWDTYKYTFTSGQVVGNMSEVALFSSSSSSADMFSRELIRDYAGNPTTISVLSDEYLEVRYELRIYPSLTPSIRTVNILGTPTRLRSIPHLGEGIHIDGVRPSMLYQGVGGAGARYASGVHSSALIGTDPVAEYYIQDYLNPIEYPSARAYVPNSRQRGIYISYAPSEVNTIGSFKSGVIYTFIGNWKVEFTPVIPKNSDRSFTLEAMVSWGRYTP